MCQMMCVVDALKAQQLRIVAQLPQRAMFPVQLSTLSRQNSCLNARVNEI